ncbi:hypothetical protein EQW78_06350 [Oerskovia turbata]|uniref:Anti-sigma factor n=1 Tax=Oerskovia turbata TaxID=1713 RepID=A0A4Q1KZL6_9CELL|nr:hypothetical protein [Oerskovia turbata]RXR25074.1 hypothetical protein EQW73_12380 [Oerskovia turbata]RXR35220.1 hypothetical protein EQW78_06350 [Oerskovia turbata]
MHVPTFVDVWLILDDADRERLAEIDETETEILDFLRTQPVEDVDAPLFSDLQVERLRVYRAALERANPGGKDRGDHDAQAQTD